MTSRRPRLVDPHDPWLAALRAVLRKIADDDATLMIGDGTAGSEFIRCLANRLHIRSQIISELPQTSEESTVPAQDAAVFRAADVIYVLSVRSGGNLQRLLTESLQARSRLESTAGGCVRGDAREIILVDLPDLQPATVRSELCQSGITLWQPAVDQCRPFERPHNIETLPETHAGSTGPDVILIVPFPAEEDWEFLSHTTRACPGPWPGETFESYVDSLIESQVEADHSPLGTLRQILIQRKLLASNRTIRDRYNVVSFTAWPLQKLPALHRFRTHRVRWDFEPYGLCIRRQWLIERGARPVIYGDESCWENLTAADRPFFQLVAGKSGIDWSIEREWRHPADLDLNQLTPEDVIVFVPDFAAARTIAQMTDWPTTLWPADRGVTN